MNGQLQAGRPDISIHVKEREKENNKKRKRSWNGCAKTQLNSEIHVKRVQVSSLKFLLVAYVFCFSLQVDTVGPDNVPQKEKEEARNFCTKEL